MDSHNIISDLSKDIFILEDELNPLTSNVSRIYPKTTIDQVYDTSNDDIKNLRQIIAELKEDIQSTGSGVIPFPVRSVNGLTGDVMITKSLLGLDKVDNTSDNEKPLSTLQLRNVITILDNYGITEPGNFSTLFNSTLNAHNVSNTAHADIRSDITGAVSTHNTSDDAHADIRSDITTAVSDHNTSSDSHSDIRTALSNHNESTTAHSDIRTAISSDISAHNVSNTAHADIRDNITTAVSTHNTSDDAHADIRSDITTAVSNHNTSSDAHSDIRVITASMFPCRTASTTYAIGDIVMVGGTMKRLECVAAGITDSGPIGTTTVGQLVVDGTVTWIVDNFFDPLVGTFRWALSVPAGWIKLSGAQVSIANYPRLWAWAVEQNLLTSNRYSNPGKFYRYGGTLEEQTHFGLPWLSDRYIRSGDNVGAYFEPQLPNIRGTLGFLRSGQMSADDANIQTNSSRVFRWSEKVTDYRMEQSSLPSGRFAAYDPTIDASKASSIYTDTDTVQPPTIELYPIMKY